MQFSVIINSQNKRNKKSLDSIGDNLCVNTKCKWTPGKSFLPPSHWNNAKRSVYLFKRLTLRALLISFIDLWWFKIQRTLGCVSRLFSATDNDVFIPFAVTVCSSDYWNRNTKDTRRLHENALSRSAKSKELWSVRVYSRVLGVSLTMPFQENFLSAEIFLQRKYFSVFKREVFSITPKGS